VQPGGPPILVGGLSAPARRRAITKGNGWFVYDTDVDAARHALEQVRIDSEKLERPTELGRLEFTTIPVGTFDRAVADQFAEAGVDRIVLTPQHDLPMDRRHKAVGVDQILKMIDNVAAELIDR
jgi:alkanesulfonate monooxygenase SsuD/methylene tetrahydromethanopterin reductase-like flavin-dependent oxidoreductase (luciferase family)